MRNGTQSNKLTLIDSSGQQVGENVDVLDPSVEWHAASTPEDKRWNEPSPAGVTPILVFVTVSLACAAAAIAAGSYALWLSRQKATRQTLMDVQDILRVCQDRMRQMEDDLHQFPDGLNSLST